MADLSDIKYTEAGVHFGTSGFVLWEDLDGARNAFRFANSVLVKVGFSYGRVSDLYDEVIYKREEWERIKAGLEGTTAYFSDFAGKHSETSVEFWSNVTLVEITDLQEIIDFHKLNGMSNSNLDIISDGILQAQENGEMDDNYNKISEE